MFTASHAIQKRYTPATNIYLLMFRNIPTIDR